MSSQAQIHLCKAIDAYLAGRVALYALEEEALDVLWNQDGDEGAQRLAGTIQLLASEMGLGDRSLESMRLELANAVRAFDLAGIILAMSLNGQHRDIHPGSGMTHFRLDDLRQVVASSNNTVGPLSVPARKNASTILTLPAARAKGNPFSFLMAELEA